MESAIIWILFGIAAAIAASNKGRSAFGWFLLGVLFGPFGLLFALLLKPMKQAEPETIASALERKCPFCAETIKAEAKLCRFCGKELPQDAALAESADREREFEEWLAAQSPPLTNLSASERTSYRQAFEYNRSQGPGLMR